MGLLFLSFFVGHSVGAARMIGTFVGHSVGNCVGRQSATMPSSNAWFRSKEDLETTHPAHNTRTPVTILMIGDMANNALVIVLVSTEK